MELNAAPSTPDKIAEAPDQGGAMAYPPGAIDANWFQFFNALSWQITLGAPAVLYAKSLGASATVLGVMAALTPLLVICQLPATHLLAKYGYRRFVLAGWTSRTAVIFAIVAIPLLGGVSPTLKLSLLLLGLFLWNFVRGIASGAWWPWMTELIPTQLRGRFLSRDSISGQSGSLLSLTAASLVLRGDARPWQFALVFLFSAIAQTISLMFLRRVPDITAPEKLKTSGHRVPWIQMIKWSPFLRLVLFNLGWVAMTGGLGVFTVSFLRGVERYTESRVLVLTALSYIGSLVMAPFVGRFIDREGSRPVLMLCLGCYLVILTGWWALAAGIAGHAVGIVAALNLLTGAASASFLVANWRLAMAVIPVMGRNHFFAMFMVITNLGLGLAPIIWGLLLDAMSKVGRRTGSIEWNRYSIYFAMAFALACVTLAYSARLSEATRE